MQALQTRSQTHAPATASDLSAFVAAAIDDARAFEAPFYHLTLTNVFPQDIYADMLDSMPTFSDYRPMSGRSRNLRADGSSTRVKLDLFTEQIRKLPRQKQEVWTRVGQALCSSAVKAAFVRRLAPGLSRRFGENFAQVGLYPVPILTRDIPGYRIPPHTDTHWKAITVQLYLPRDATKSHIGTIFHNGRPNGDASQDDVRMQFLPNTGYGFAVHDDSWHSADPVGEEVDTRDSILLTYFVDNDLLRLARNRGKRLGNFLQQEFHGNFAQLRQLVSGNQTKPRTNG